MDLIGESVHFEFTSGDATTAAVVTIYDNDGGLRPLTPGERLCITDIHITAEAAMTVDVFNGVGAAPGAGERLFKTVASATIGTAYPSLDTAAYGKKGVTPKVKTSAVGNVTVIGTGVILRS